MVSMSYRDPVTKALIELPMGCAGGGSPVGFCGPYMGSVAPNGWVIADGRAHNSPALRTLLGSDYTPDLRDRFILAAGPTHAARTTGGEENHTLTAAEMPSHSHGGAVTAENEEHTHSGRTGLHADGVNAAHSHPTGRKDGTGGPPESSGWDGTVYKRHTDAPPGGYWTDLYAGSVNTDHQHDFSTGGRSATHTHGVWPEGGGAAHNNMPPYYAMIYIIKAFEESAKDGITLEEADARYVNVVGDEMTGRLKFNLYTDTPIGVGPADNGAGGEDGISFTTAAGDAYVPAYLAHPTNPQHAATKFYADLPARSLWGFGQASNGWLVPSGQNTVERAGRMVQYYIRLYNNAGAAQTTGVAYPAGTIPVGYRPQSVVLTRPYVVGGGSVNPNQEFTISVSPDGSVSVGKYTNESWPAADRWMTASGVYMVADGS